PKTVNFTFSVFRTIRGDGFNFLPSWHLQHRTMVQPWISERAELPSGTSAPARKASRPVSHRRRRHTTRISAHVGCHNAHQGEAHGTGNQQQPSSSHSRQYRQKYFI